MDVFSYLDKLSASSWTFLFIGILILAEIIFVIIIRTTKRERDVGLVSYTITMKIGAWMFAFFGLMFIAIILYFIEPILWVIGIAGIIVGYIVLNYWIVKKFSKVETEEEETKRLREEQEELGENSQFKIGDKVRLKRDISYGDYYNSNCGSKRITFKKDMMEFKNKNLTIIGFDGDGDLKIKEDKNRFFWCDEMFYKVKDKKKKRK